MVSAPMAGLHADTKHAGKLFGRLRLVEVREIGGQRNYIAAAGIGREIGPPSGPHVDAKRPNMPIVAARV